MPSSAAGRRSRRRVKSRELELEAAGEAPLLGALEPSLLCAPRLAASSRPRALPRLAALPPLRAPRPAPVRWHKPERGRGDAEGSVEEERERMGGGNEKI